MYVLKTIEEVISYRMREIRGNRNQDEMAEFLQIPFRTYQAIEAGGIPRAATRRAIAKRLSISETTLFLDPDLTTASPGQALDIIRDALTSKVAHLSPPPPCDPTSFDELLRLLRKNPKMIDRLLKTARISLDPADPALAAKAKRDDFG
jgi:transcriptional regulator with XRE-family HTH domain